MLVFSLMFVGGLRDTFSGYASFPIRLGMRGANKAPQKVAKMKLIRRFPQILADFFEEKWHEWGP